MEHLTFLDWFILISLIIGGFLGVIVLNIHMVTPNNKKTKVPETTAFTIPFLVLSGLFFLLSGGLFIWSTQAPYHFWFTWAGVQMNYLSGLLVLRCLGQPPLPCFIIQITGMILTLLGVYGYFKGAQEGKAGCMFIVKVGIYMQLMSLPCCYWFLALKSQWGYLVVLLINTLQKAFITSLTWTTVQSLTGYDQLLIVEVVVFYALVAQGMVRYFFKGPFKEENLKRSLGAWMVLENTLLIIYLLFEYVDEVYYFLIFSRVLGVIWISFKIWENEPRNPYIIQPQVCKSKERSKFSGKW